MIRRELVASLAILLLGGCEALAPLAGSGAANAGPADPAAATRPDLIVVDPAVAAPGDIVALTFPEETSRGVHFVLEQRTGDGWAYRYDLTSDGPGPGWQMDWQAAGEAGFAVPDIGVGGPGPDRVRIPETAEPGAYRICTGNAGDEFCAELEIAAP